MASCGVGSRRLAASTIAVAIVVARFFVAPGLPHRTERRTAIATSPAGQRTLGRSARVEEDLAGVTSAAGIGALLAPPAAVPLPVPPPPIAAPPYAAPAAPRAALPPLPARARAPPVTG